MKKTCAFLLFPFALSTVVQAATWYVRPDGGTRYSASVPAGQCDGLANAAYSGDGGTNEHCAFNDIRYLWADGSWNGNWALLGGDTVIISNTYPSGETGWRTGNTSANGGQGLFNNFSGWPNALGTGVMPPIPSGTSGNPTQILGANYASCSSPSQESQIYGGWATDEVLNLQGSQYVNVECIDLTDHNNCIKFGNAGKPAWCNGNPSNGPISDYANQGIFVLNTTSNILFQDMNIHGFPSSGVYGAIGGPFTLTRVRFADNGFAGWNFDNGTANGPGASITASYVTVEWNGCNEEYPIQQQDTIPITYCYSEALGGFGDGFSGQDAYLSFFTGDHLTLRYNVKDPFFGPHTAIGAVTIRDSIAYGNGGQTWKWNSGIGGTVLFQNNLTLNNCNRMTAPMAGVPSTYNTYFVDSCRADGAAMSFIFPINGSFEMDGNTFGIANTNAGFDMSCWYLLTGIAVASGGSGYQMGDVLLIGGTGALATVTSVDNSGAVTGLNLTAQGETNDGAGYTYQKPYVGGGHGTGVNVTFTTETNGDCTQGPRIMRDNLFFGITDSLSGGWNGETIGLFCYANCDGSAGNSNDGMWTTRSNNLMYGFKANSGMCSYPTEICSDPLLVNEPSTTLSSQSQLDNFSFSLSNASPAIGAGVAIFSLNTDYNGFSRPTPPSTPSIGALEFGSVYTPPPPGTTPPPSSGLPTPLLNLPSTLPLNTSIDFSYPSGYSNVQFVWSIVPIASGGNVNVSPTLRSSNTPGGTIGATTAAPGLNLAPYGFIPGRYTISVYAMDGVHPPSLTASQNVNLVLADLSNVRVYPNPWRKDKHANSPITFDLLPYGSTVKIFTASGHLVKTLTPNVSTATWDLTNDSGDKVASGIYLYLVTQGNTGYGGTAQKTRGKLAVIR